MKLEVLTKKELIELIREHTSLSEEVQVRQALERRKLRLENQIGDCNGKLNLFYKEVDDLTEQYSVFKRWSDLGKIISLNRKIESQKKTLACLKKQRGQIKKKLGD